ncbi:MAG TPA: ATP-binding protein [Gemmatimonadaceae bacterium]|nr:ATP-binding protein [Gemmatimonadaceae bacterium]
MPTHPNQADDTERRLLVQYAISRALAASGSDENTMQRVLAELGTNLGWRFGAFWVVEAERQVLRAEAVWRRDGGHESFAAATLATVLPRGRGLPGRVWETGEPAWAVDVQQLENFPRQSIAREEGLRGAFAFPVMTLRGGGTRVLGALEFFSTQVEEPDEWLLRAAAGIGYQLGVFLELRDALAAERSSRVRNAATIEVALDCIVSIDQDGRVLEWNPAAERTFGYTRAQALGREIGQLIVPPGLRQAHYRGLARYLATGEARVLGRRIEVEGMRADGSIFPCELAITRVPLAGPPTFTAYLRDLTERRRLERSQELLLRASVLLGSSLDYEQTLRNLSHVVVPAFADWYAVHLAGEDGTLRAIEVAHENPDKTQLARKLEERYPQNPLLHQVLRTGRSAMEASITPELVESAAHDPEHLRALRELGLRSFIMTPLRARTAVIGVLSLVTADSGRRYDTRDLALAEELAARAGQAIENARLFREAEESRQLLEQQATELESQATEMEETAAELELSNEELRGANEELARRTQDAERARADAEQARQEADEANRTKSDFLAAMSHELRTPLNAIMGYAQLLELGVHGAIDDTQREDVHRIDRSAQHLLALINDILNFAKLERGHVRYQLREMPMHDVLARLGDLVIPQARAKHLQYEVTDDSGGATVCGDADKIVQILVNVLSNAVRFTAEGGRIDVHCAATSTAVLTSVRDTGVGIPPDKLEAVFEPFVQVDRTYTSQRQGAGLGLAISRELARGMGGELTAFSTVGRGSEFVLELPREN